MATLPTFKQLRYLSALGDTLNFTKAAALCFVGQSTLSAGLKELEDALGIQLVERDRQTVSFTSAGEEILKRAKVLLTGAEDMQEFIRAAEGTMTGLIKLGVIPTIAPFLLPKILPKLKKELPHLKIALREDLSANLISKLNNHELDFAIIALPYETEGLLIKNLFNDEFWLVAQPDDPALKNKDTRVSPKMAERLLLLEEGHCLREHSLQACKKTEIASASGMEATSLLTLVQMLEYGMGIALIPEMAIKAGLLNQTKLIARPLSAPAPKRTIAIIARQSTARLEEFNAFVKVINGGQFK